MRPAPHRRDAPQLAVPARSPHRRLCADSQPGDRLSKPDSRLTGSGALMKLLRGASAFACPPSGNRMKARGSPGPTTATISARAALRPFPWWFTARSSASSSRFEKSAHPADDGIARSARRAAVLRKVGAAMDAIEFFECPTDRVWTRDYAPLFLAHHRRPQPPRRSGASMGGRSILTTSVTTPPGITWQRTRQLHCERERKGRSPLHPRHLVFRRWCSKAAA